MESQHGYILQLLHRLQQVFCMNHHWFPADGTQVTQGRGHTEETGNRSATAISVSAQGDNKTVLGKASNSECYTPSAVSVILWRWCITRTRRLTMVPNTQNPQNYWIFPELFISLTWTHKLRLPVSVLFPRLKTSIRFYTEPRRSEGWQIA
jgi:hypothetical protein